MDFSEQGQDPSKKFTGIIVVVLVHALVVWAFVSGLATQIVAKIKDEPIETKVIEEVKPPPPPPDAPPPPPKLAAPPPPFIPPPEVQVATPQTNNTISQVSNVQPPHQDLHPQAPVKAAPPAAGPSVVKAVVDCTSCEKPDYPRNSLRNEEQGVVRIQFLIGLDGRVADSKIEKSSGFRGLDQAAVKALSLCKFKPGLIDGKPQQSWTAVDYVWKLPD